MKNKQKNTGFTLIELLVVISIIGILSTMAVVSLNNARLKARDSKRVADMRQFQTALELYLSDMSGYPAANDLTLGVGAGLTLSKDAGLAAIPIGTLYMGKVPLNPMPGGSDYKYTSYTNSTASTVCNTGPCAWFQVIFTLEDQTGGLSQGAHKTDPTGMN